MEVYPGSRIYNGINNFPRWDWGSAELLSFGMPIVFGLRTNLQFVPISEAILLTLGK